MYEDVLVPFDGSDGAAAVLHHAAEIASAVEATIHLLSVADTTRDSVTRVETQVVDTLVQEGEATLAEAAETLDTLGVAYDTDVVQGNPAPTIAEYATRYDHDLIVMATHGRQGIARYLVGSVTEKVVRLSSVPVLTARLQPDERLRFPYENVLIATDGSDSAARAGEHGLSLAGTVDATAHLLAVVADRSLGPDVRSLVSRQEREQAGADAVDALAADPAASGVDTVRHVEHGRPIEVILDTIESYDIDVVVMGTTGRRGTDRILLGSVAEKTVRSSPVPVLTLAAPE